MRRFICLFLMIAAAPFARVKSDSVRTVYRMNYWWDGGITLGTGIGNLLAEKGLAKSNLTDEELASLDPNNVPSFDRISLHQNIALVPQWDVYAKDMQFVGAAMPLLLLADHDIRQDWMDMLLMGLE